MKFRIYFSKGFFPLLISFLIILYLAGCAEDSHILDNDKSQQLEFSVTTHDWNNSNKSSAQKVPSRATLISGSTFDTSNSFNVIADVNKGSDWSTEVNNETVSYSSNNIWQTATAHYWSGPGSTVNFYAYYPTSILNNITHTTGSVPIFSYTVPDNVTDQIDILTSSKIGVAGDSYNQTPVDFKHIFAAVQFQVGSSGLPVGTITKITLNNILYKGTYSLDGTWTPNTTDKKSFSQTVSASTNAGTAITSDTTTFMMMPQTLNDASVTVTYSDGGTLSKTISGSWEAGKIYTYNLSKTIPVANFDYTGEVQSYTVPLTGTYKLEVWGAAGGKGWADGVEGYGGYSYGNTKLTAGQNLFVYVGQSGLDTISVTQKSYNGGGLGQAAGGGATHVSTTNRGELKNYESYQEEVLIVAGGGGGVEWSGTGGYGGGLIGGNGESQATNSWPESASAMGGNQTSGGTSVAQPTSVCAGPKTLVNGSFGQGGYGYENSNTDYGAGGGGGWYGGGGTSVCGAAGGGSGHIGPALISGTTGMQNGVRSGNGYARITFISAN